jgi:hypothetical protein
LIAFFQKNLLTPKTLVIKSLNQGKRDPKDQRDKKELRVNKRDHRDSSMKSEEAAEVMLLSRIDVANHSTKEDIMLLLNNPIINMRNLKKEDNLEKELKEESIEVEAEVSEVLTLMTTIFLSIKAEAPQEEA